MLWEEFGPENNPVEHAGSCFISESSAKIYSDFYTQAIQAEKKVTTMNLADA